jgi:hypothetical protein
VHGEPGGSLPAPPGRQAIPTFEDPEGPLSICTQFHPGGQSKRVQQVFAQKGCGPSGMHMYETHSSSELQGSPLLGLAMRLSSQTWWLISPGL